MEPKHRDQLSVCRADFFERLAMFSRSIREALSHNAASVISANTRKPTRTTSLWFISMPWVAHLSRSVSMSCASASCMENARLTTGLA
ncbi:hypothetical protein AVME950_20670 [Acidovorax sp. SUPP950]|uniref:hypothetical protein n=1 Tax=Acidovorax sp. SUPP950 TaxID=511901 RepID=UPI0023C3289A|nr:hypothetical protein [Acidovorax sp. SUPP950]GKS77352.1 hypothetical protein AVME950_20670 [Acidovorax sp. SUPP950]